MIQPLSKRQLIPLGEVGKWIGGGTPSKARAAFWAGGSIPWVSPKDMKTPRISDAIDHITPAALENSATNLVRRGSVLVVVRSGILKHTLPVAINDRDVALNQDMKAVFPRDGILADYLALTLKAFERQILHECTKSGVTVQSIILPAFLRFKVPVGPISEQRRVINEIDRQFTRLDTATVTLRRALANLRRYRTAILRAGYEGRLAPKEARSAFADAKEGGSTTSWPQVPLGRIIKSMKNGIYKPRSFYTSDGTPCLRMYNIEDGRIVWKDIKRMRLSAAEKVDYGLIPGDVLVNRVNSRELVGKSATIPPGLEQCVFESKNIRLRIDRLRADPAYVGYALQTYGPDHFHHNAQQVVGMASISQPQIAALMIPLPPLQAQRGVAAEIERHLSVLEGTSLSIEKNLERAVSLRRSVLQRIFKGDF